MTWYVDKHTTFFVYVLLDEEDLCRYVGLTVNPSQRQRVHLITAAQAYRGDTPLKRWLLASKARGFRPPLVVMEKVAGLQAARIREVHWMDLYRGHGCALLNTAGMPGQATLGQATQAPVRARGCQGPGQGRAGPYVAPCRPRVGA